MAHNGGRAMPQDLEFIMQMVHGDPAAPAGPSVAAVDGAQAVEVVAAPELKETETDSEASTDNDAGSDETDSDDDSEDASDEDVAAKPAAASASPAQPSAAREPKSFEIKTDDQPMTAQKHASLLAQLSSFMGTEDAELNADGEGYITADSDEEDGELGEDEEESEVESDDGRPDPANVLAMEDDDDEPVPSGPLLTANEVVEEPVRAPPVQRLKEGAIVVFAGKVVHYVPEPTAVKAAQRAAEAEAAAPMKPATASAEQPSAGMTIATAGEDAEEGELMEDEPGQKTDLDAGMGEAAKAEGEAEIKEDMVDKVTEDTRAAPPPEDGNKDSNAAVTIPVAGAAAAGALIADEDIVDLVAAPAISPAEGGGDQSAPVADPIMQAEVTAPSPVAADDSAGPSQAIVAAPTPSKPDTKGKGKAKEPKILSSGKVVVRAMRPPEGVFIGERRVGDDEGWLEEGSLVCFKDGRVIATVAETFGPLTSPFYLLRLPPPPFPMPSTDELAPGTAVYYPSTQNRSYVPVRLLRTDKRYKGSDASNRYDEEVGDDEREWSDDEEEAMAKRGEKLRRQGRTEGSGSADRGGPSRSRHYDDAGGSDGGALDYGGDAMSVDGGMAYDQDAGARGRGRGRGGARGGERGRGTRGGRGGRGGGPTGRVEEQTVGGRGRGRGGPVQRGGVRPQHLPVAKPSEATINMAETIGRRDGTPQGRPDGAPVAPLPARPLFPIPAAPPIQQQQQQQQGYPPQMPGYPGQGGPQGGFPQQQQWNPQQMGFGMQPNMMQPQGFYGGMPGFGGPQGGFPQMYGGMPGAQGIGCMPQQFGYPGFAPQGAAINPRFMAQVQGMTYAPQAPNGHAAQQQQQQHPGYHPGPPGQ